MLSTIPIVTEIQEFIEIYNLSVDQQLETVTELQKRIQSKSVIALIKCEE